MGAPFGRVAWRVRRNQLTHKGARIPHGNMMGVSGVPGLLKLNPCMGWKQRGEGAHPSPRDT